MYPSDQAPLTSQGRRGLAEALDSELLQEHFEDDDPFDDLDGDNRYAAQEFTALTDDDETEQEGADTISSQTMNTSETPHPSPTPSGHLRGTLPAWLGDEYADACEQLTQEIKMKGRPKCYEDGGFVMQTPPLIFRRPIPHEIRPFDFYRPKFFVWLPHLFHRIPCPSCKEAGRRTQTDKDVMLRVLGWPKHARRVVDVEQLLFIIGHRYYCGHEECRKTYQSWSPAILRSIPHTVATMFRFHLTYRCGLTDRLVGLLRASFQRGIGPSPFVEYLRTLHLRYYEQQHIGYLEAVQERTQGIVSGLLPKATPFPRWNDPTGYAGYVPSHRYFRCFYDHLIEQHASEIDQHMALLSAEIISHDHSHKVCKSIPSLHSESVVLY